MLLLHHYANRSVESVSDSGTMPIYDGSDYYIPPFHSVILVPCKSEDPDHWLPSLNSCQLLTSTDVHTDEGDSLLIMYLIDNTSDTGLLLRHGDLLGSYYTGKHANIKAERSYMLTDNYNLLIDEQQQYRSKCWRRLSMISKRMRPLGRMI
jgi:hypothetical protein